MRIVCERCGKERIIAETHMPRDDAEGVTGNAADPEVLATAKLPAAGRLVVTIPQVFEAGRARANPCFSWPSQKLLVAVVLARALTEPGEPRSVKPSTHEPFQLVLSPGYHSLVRLT